MAGFCIGGVSKARLGVVCFLRTFLIKKMRMTVMKIHTLPMALTLIQTPPMTLMLIQIPPMALTPMTPIQTPPIALTLMVRVHIQMCEKI